MEGNAADSPEDLGDFLPINARRYGAPLAHSAAAGFFSAHTQTTLGTTVVHVSFAPHEFCLQSLTFDGVVHAWSS